MTQDEFSELIDLANAHIEGGLEKSQRERLENILQSDQEARRVFVDYLHDHAALHWEEVSLEGDTKTTPSVIPFSEEFESSKPPSRRGGIALAWGLAAAFAVAAIGMGWWLGRSEDTATFATMEDSRSARWESGDLPTSAGARLGSGQLRLAEGLATLLFDSGARVILEAPVEISLVDSMNCELQEGTAVADIPESAHGFRIETPSARVVDHGTRFAVNVDPDTGATRTQVFEGLVEVEHPASGKIVALETGEENVAAGNATSDATEGTIEGQWSPATTSSPISGPEWTVRTTSRDGYVYARDIPGHQSDILLLVKHGLRSDSPHRKAYLAFDLSDLTADSISDAELTLYFSPTGWGLASSVSDARFGVYALVDPALDHWEESTLHWDTAPANNPDDGGALLAPGAKRLGSFEVPQGVQRGAFGFRSEALTEFLRTENADGIATLVVVRETIETDDGGLVHGFAGRRHPTLPAPTLAIRQE